MMIHTGDCVMCSLHFICSVAGYNRDLSRCFPMDYFLNTVYDAGFSKMIPYNQHKSSRRNGLQDTILYALYRMPYTVLYGLMRCAVTACVLIVHRFLWHQIMAQVVHSAPLARDIPKMAVFKKGLLVRIDLRSYTLSLCVDLL